jgi:predicted component of type VI protein secretion system
MQNEYETLITTVLTLDDFKPSRVLKNVMSAAKTRQKLAKKRSLLGVNEHFEPIFNAVFASVIDFQHPAISKEFLLWLYLDNL